MISHALLMDLHRVAAMRSEILGKCGGNYSNCRTINMTLLAHSSLAYPCPNSIPCACKLPDFSSTTSRSREGPAINSAITIIPNTLACRQTSQTKHPSFSGPLHIVDLPRFSMLSMAVISLSASKLSSPVTSATNGCIPLLWAFEYYPDLQPYRPASSRTRVATPVTLVADGARAPVATWPPGLRLGRSVSGA